MIIKRRKKRNTDGGGTVERKRARRLNITFQIRIFVITYLCDAADDILR